MVSQISAINSRDLNIGVSPGFGGLIQGQISNPDVVPCEKLSASPGCEMLRRQGFWMQRLERVEFSVIKSLVCPVFFSPVLLFHRFPLGLVGFFVFFLCVCMVFCCSISISSPRFGTRHLGHKKLWNVFFPQMRILQRRFFFCCCCFRSKLEVSS